MSAFAATDSTLWNGRVLSVFGPVLIVTGVGVAAVGWLGLR